MTTLLLIVMLASWVFMSIAILLMAPKWWLGFGLGWMWGNNEYGTKKSIETSLKSAATICAIIFVLSSLVYPFTKEKKFDPDAASASWATAPNFDLWSNNTWVENTVVIGSWN